MGDLHNIDTNISMIQMIVYLVVAVILFASTAADPQEFFVSLYGLLAVGAVLSVAELGIGSSYILGLHKNGLGSSLGAALLVGVELWISNLQPKRRWLIGVASVINAAGLLCSLSRGAWLGTLAGLCVILGLRRELKRMLQLLILILPVIVVLWIFLPPESRIYATNITNSESAEMRHINADYAYDLFLQSPVKGIGVAVRKEFDATNVAFSTLAETGVVGLAAFALVHFVVFGMAVKSVRLLAIRDPWYTFPTLGAALIAMKLTHGMVDHYWSRGTSPAPGQGSEWQPRSISRPGGEGYGRRWRVTNEDRTGISWVPPTCRRRTHRFRMRTVSFSSRPPRASPCQ